MLDVSEQLHNEPLDPEPHQRNVYSRNTPISVIMHLAVVDVEGQAFVERILSTTVHSLIIAIIFIIIIFITIIFITIIFITIIFITIIFITIIFITIIFITHYLHYPLSSLPIIFITDGMTNGGRLTLY
ncbi:uncharacterized protein PV07_08374 [Cladophialophora immunda]|uniref:Uncharacterized protein n=1 Tax=Cladophialophora immunda TaxID=569365 RepID=A0A0D1ZL75_9EURO|nr:uncharacterized protein PV07_08374 [Cladophialophora immunda]KIW28736.1 hypothetical protein PV07_08374 [Cladophialophora immunda]